MRELLLGAAAGPALHRKQPRGGVCPPGGAQDPGLRGQAPSAVRGWSPEGPVRTPHWPPPTTPEPGGPGLLPLDPTAQATLAICLGGLAGVQGPTAQPPISWQGHTLEVSSGGRRGLGRHSPGSQAGEGTRAASHPVSGEGMGLGGQQSPHKRRLPIGARKPTPAHKPHLAACSAPFSPRRSSRKEPWTRNQEARAAAPAPALRVPPGGQGEEAGPRA